MLRTILNSRSSPHRSSTKYTSVLARSQSQLSLSMPWRNYAACILKSIDWSILCQGQHVVKLFCHERHLYWVLQLRWAWLSHCQTDSKCVQIYSVYVHIIEMSLGVTMLNLCLGIKRLWALCSSKYLPALSLSRSKWYVHALLRLNKTKSALMSLWHELRLSWEQATFWTFSLLDSHVQIGKVAVAVAARICLVWNFRLSRLCIDTKLTCGDHGS